MKCYKTSNKLKLNKIKIISFSGIDGSGKGTQISLIEEWFKIEKIGYKTIWARGSWTPGIELIKRIVRRDRSFSEQQKTEYRSEARSDPGKQKIIVILSILDLFWYFGIYYRMFYLFRKIVLCDRYIWDTLVDFRVNFKNINFEKWIIWKMLLFFIPKPNPSFIFLITAEKSVERGLKKKEAYMEEISVKQQKVNEYARLISQNKWSNVIDGNFSIQKIFLKVKEALTK